MHRAYRTFYPHLHRAPTALGTQLSTRPQGAFSQTGREKYPGEEVARHAMGNYCLVLDT